MDQSLFNPAFAQPAGSPIRELFPYLGRPGMLSLAGGYPSPALFDAEGLRAAAAAALADPAGTLQYGATEGTPALREALAGLSRQRGLAADAGDILVTTGSQQGFDLLLRVLLQPGDVVLVESPTYPAVLQALTLAGVQALPVPMDRDGLRVDAIEPLLAGLPPGRRPRLLYTVPSYSNPRGSRMPQARRAALVALAVRHRLLIVEDDPYGELRFDAEASPGAQAGVGPAAVGPVGADGSARASRHADPAAAAITPLHALGHALCGPVDNPVIHLSSLSKTVAPALRIGWMLASEPLRRRCAIAKQTVDLCTSPLSQAVAAHYLASGRYAPTVEAARQAYARRALVLTDGLRALPGDALQVEPPRGGMFLWLEDDGGAGAAGRRPPTPTPDPRRLFDAAVAEGVLFVPGAAFHVTPPSGLCLRLSFAALDEAALGEAVHRLARAWARALEPVPTAA
ncbi:MAG: hypothetical protein RL223_4261 [Pseudomonadota bacterium]